MTIIARENFGTAAWFRPGPAGFDVVFAGDAADVGGREGRLGGHIGRAVAVKEGGDDGLYRAFPSGRMSGFGALVVTPGLRKLLHRVHAEQSSASLLHYELVKRYYISQQQGASQRDGAAEMTTTETLTQMVTEAHRMLPTCGPAGQPWQKRTRVVNGHIVQVNVWDFERVTVEIDKSTEPLTVEEAATRIA